MFGLDAAQVPVIQFVRNFLCYCWHGATYCVLGSKKCRLYHQNLGNKELETKKILQAS